MIAAFRGPHRWCGHAVNDYPPREGERMFAMLRYNGDAPESMLEEDGHLTVEFDWENDRKQYRCRGCDSVFTEEEDAEDEECEDAECEVHTDDENCDDHDCEYGGHDLIVEEEPLSWVNSVGIHFNEEQNQIDLSISVGDPRGAFVMRMYQTDKGLRMGVPRPGDSLLHAPLREINDGFYAVGPEKEAE